jgi:photosystem II stability/assembly factor-like uncharacterized protein
MKKILVIAIVALFSTNNWAQNLLKPTQTEITSLPTWAQLMYSDNPSIFEVDNLFREYYKINNFKKTYHTQYYKRWRRKYLNYSDENGFIHLPNHTDIEKDESEYRKKQVALKSSNWNIVGPITNYQEGGYQGSGQTNVYCVDQCINSPSFLYCGTEPGEVYKSSNEGLNWTLVSLNENFGSGVTAIEVHSTNPDIVFAGGNNGVFRSLNGGQTWTNVLPNSNFGVNEILIHPTNDQLIFACTDKGLFRSSDGGTTWTQLFSNKTYDIKTNTADFSILYIVRNNPTSIICEFLKSTDIGITWNVQSNGWFMSTDAARNDGGARLATTPADPNRIYAYLIGEAKANDFGYIGVYRSDDGGSTWTLPNGPAGGPYTTDHINLAIGWPEWTYHQGFYNCALMASSTNPDEIVVGGLNLYKSTDGGISFESVAGYVGGPLSMHVDMQDFRIVGNTAWISTDGGIYRSNDFFNSNYEFRMSGVHGSDYWGFDSGWNEDVLVGGLYHNGNLAYHENYGSGNFLELGGGEAPTGYVNPGQNRKTYFSDISGKIIPINLSDPIANAAFGMAPNESYWAAESSEMEFHPNCYSIAYIGKDNSIWKTTDGGASFNLLYSFGTNSNNQIKYIEISSSNPNVIYVNQQPSSGSNGILWKTTDGGISWLQLNKPSENSRRMLLAINPLDENELWLAYPDGSNGFKVFRTSNSGQTWENLGSSLFNNESVQALHHIAGTDGGIYIATNRAVYYRNNQTQFQLDNSGLPLFTSGNIFQPFYRDGKIRLASYGKGIWESNLNETPSFPIARAMVDKLSQEVVCAIDSFYFEDHSFLNHSNASWNWTFPTGFPNSSTQRNPSVLFTEAGSHIAILQITDGNGNTDSDTIQVTVNNFTLPTSISEGFEGTFLPSGWSINNPNNDAQWSLSSNAGGYGATSKSSIFDNYNNDSQGNADDLILYLEPSSILTNSYLKFDVAYARWGAGYSDTLEVLVSTDCGSTYQSLYLKGGTDLATSPDFQEYFTPTSTQWRTDSLDLSSFSNEINLQIAFRNIGRYGNVIYLDNINIGNLATINDQENFAPIIYPNPVRAGENIAIELNGTFSIALIDQKGTIIKRETGDNKTHLLISPTLAQGMYNIQIKTETKIWNNPIVIVK